MAILDNADHATQSLSTNNGLVDPKQALALLQKVKGLASLEIAPDGSVIGQFSDGVPYTFCNNLPINAPLSPPDHSVVEPPFHSGSVDRTGSFTQSTPASKVAVLVDESDPYLFSNRLTPDEQLLNANGYPGTKLQLATTSAFRNLRNSPPIGFISIAGHGMFDMEGKGKIVNWGCTTSILITTPLKTNWISPPTA
jgi:hypothetical protein